MSDVIIVESPRQEIIVEAGARGLPGALRYGLYPAGLLIDPAQIELLNVRAEVAVGTTEVYTVPTAKRAFISIVFRINTAGTSNFSGLNAIVGGNPVRLQFPASTIPGGGGQAVATSLIILSPGEKVTVTSSLAGLVVFVLGQLVPETVPLQMAALINLSTAPQLFIECPPSNQVVPVLNNNGTPVLSNVMQPVVINDSGVTATISAYLVPNGQTLGPQHLVSAGGVASGGNPSVFQIPVNVMRPGDAIYLQSSSNNPGCWVRQIYAQFPL